MGFNNTKEETNSETEREERIKNLKLVIYLKELYGNKDKLKEFLSKNLVRIYTYRVKLNNLP